MRVHRQSAIEIWKAGVDAVESTRLVSNAIQIENDQLVCGSDLWKLKDNSRICVVGAGKAGAGMAAGIESILPDEWLNRTEGWVNVPADCVSSLRRIHLHAARPAGVNEPTDAGAEGTRRILELIGSLGPDDLCLVVISGGGSALLPAPPPGVTLEQKQKLTRTLMHSGATIHELNSVRRALSEVKGGGLLRACRAGQLICLIISDVIGDPLDTIASGPTVETQSDPEAAIAVLESRCPDETPEAIWKALRQQVHQQADHSSPITTKYSNHIVGNNSTSVSAATRKAGELGYKVISSSADLDGDADEIGKSLAQRCLDERNRLSSSEKICVIEGGEPTVSLAKTDLPRRGGRNQQVVLAAAEVLKEADSSGITILSGGTDGEDGPTDAAGAVIDSELLAIAEQQSLTIDEFLSINNSYPFFEAIGGLLKTGPTHTNVMDLRVALVCSKDNAD
ncbi:putative hydroxypyruvate reductase [Thalassoglobus neptunius]|uniref:Putative hydroxypyruvate reductase n=1 Tax=Thalassoglobus neptunius TaxID=1938619 RepID=A0A5C5X7B1_9PLAN|nr:DUF4147 domain-containing protein [Thalassoglobus neptunius]TWT57912.1 putative hydroxypyruvate reductase [Thalassoglobus neptunius]